MNKLFFLALAALSFAASADDMVAQNGKDRVRLTQEACHAAVMPLLAQSFEKVAPRFRAAYAEVDGGQHMACWVMRPDGKVLLIYSDGDAGLIPWIDFTRTPSI